MAGGHLPLELHVGLHDQPFATWILNSAIVSIATTILGVFLACTAAYAFSRFRFPGRRAGLMSFLVSQMFPGTLMLIPLYIILVKWLSLGEHADSASSSSTRRRRSRSASGC